MVRRRSLIGHFLTLHYPHPSTTTVRTQGGANVGDKSVETAARLQKYDPAAKVTTAMQKWRVVMLGFGTARQKMALERWTNPKPRGTIYNRAAI
jgi:hypothetical protein